MIDYSKFQGALTHLERQQRNRLTLDARTPTLIREAVDESVIQRFETGYDALWKVLRRHLTEALSVPDAPHSPKPTFRLANENHLLPSPVARWLAYAQARINTSHDYSSQKAWDCLALMDDFIADATALNRTLTAQGQNELAEE